MSTNIKAEKAKAKRACLTCLRRKRWCDRSLPKCLMCNEAQRQCEGYGANVIRTFVNLDVTNVSRPNKKRLLCEALAESKKSSIVRSDQPHIEVIVSRIKKSSHNNEHYLSGVSVVSLQADFSHHVETLWRTFLLGYCQTKDYWPPGCSALALRNRALDLSLVALSAQRLALNKPGSDLRVLGLTAYNNSINLFRRVIQHERNASVTAMLAVTSTVYALVEASLMQPNDIAHFGWGKSGHFDGALALMQQSGPTFFSLDGYHLVFKKIREMGVFFALTRRQKTFLLAKEWMTVPWEVKSKTWRDKLYDLVLEFSKILAESEGNEPTSHPLELPATEIDKALQIEVELGLWKSAWLKEMNLQNCFICDCKSLSQFSCICSLPVPKFPSADFALLQVECWSLQLLISTILSILTDTETNRQEWNAKLPSRSSQIFNHMDEAFSLPVFKYTAERSSGVTEGFCRTIFPTWTMKQYRDSQTKNNNISSFKLT